MSRTARRLTSALVSCTLCLSFAMAQDAPTSTDEKLERLARSTERIAELLEQLLTQNEAAGVMRLIEIKTARLTPNETRYNSAVESKRSLEQQLAQIDDYERSLESEILSGEVSPEEVSEMRAMVDGERDRTRAQIETFDAQIAELDMQVLDQRLEIERLEKRLREIMERE